DHLAPDALTDRELTDLVQTTEKEVINTQTKLAELLAKHANQNETMSQLESDLQWQLNSFGGMKQKLDNIEITGTDVSIGNIKSVVGNVKEEIDVKVNSLLKSIDTMRDQTKTMNDYSEFLSDVQEGEDYVKRLKKITSGHTFEPE